VVFRTGEQPEVDPSDEFIFRPRGLNPAWEYQVRLDNQRLVYHASGAELASLGIRVHLEPNLSSELFLFS
jgi:hypothetical protein